MPCSYCGWSGEIGRRGAEKGIVKGLCKNCYYQQKRYGSLERTKVRHECSVPECNRFVVSHGYCELHWNRVKNYGDPNATSRPADWGKREKHPLYESWRWMVRKQDSDLCDRWKDFWKFAEDVGERPSEVHSISRPEKVKPYGPDNFEWKERIFLKLHGEEEKEYMRRYMREYRKAFPDRARSKDLKKSYGITLEQYNAMLKEQNGVCAICGNADTVIDRKTGKVRNLSVDHCHAKGKVRKLLCSTCNHGLGSFKDDPSLLRAAADYLESHDEGVIPGSEAPAVLEDVLVRAQGIRDSMLRDEELNRRFR